MGITVYTSVEHPDNTFTYNFDSLQKLSDGRLAVCDSADALRVFSAPPHLVEEAAREVPFMGAGIAASSPVLPIIYSMVNSTSDPINAYSVETGELLYSSVGTNYNIGGLSVALNRENEARLLFSDVFGNLYALNDTGSSIVQQAFLDDSSRHIYGWYLYSLPPVFGDDSWRWVRSSVTGSIVSDAYPHSIEMFTFDGATITRDLLFDFPDNEPALFTEPLDLLRCVQPLFDLARNQWVLVAEHASTGILEVVAVDATDLTTVNWRTVIPSAMLGSMPNTNGRVQHTIYNYLGLTGTSGAVLLELTEGSVVDSGLASISIGSSASSYWDEAAGGIVYERNSAGQPLGFITFDFLLYPTEPDEADPVSTFGEYATTLRAGPVNRVMNTNMTRINEALSLLMDEDGTDVVKITVDLNGHNLVNLAEDARPQAIKLKET